MHYLSTTTALSEGKRIYTVPPLGYAVDGEFSAVKDFISEPNNCFPQGWRPLCGKAVAFLGSQKAFRKEVNILKRLVKQFGPDEVERMIAGAKLLGWSSLRSLGSRDGLGRRWALARYWQEENTKPPKPPERLKAILWKIANS